MNNKSWVKEKRKQKVRTIEFVFLSKTDKLQPRIRLLDSMNPTFIDEIKKLDKISPTLYCTGQIFYLKKNQRTINESLSNTVGLEEEKKTTTFENEMCHFCFIRRCLNN